MAFPMPSSSTYATNYQFACTIPSDIPQPFISFSTSSKIFTGFGCKYASLCCYAAAKQRKSGGGSSATKKTKQPSSRNNSKRLTGDDFEIQKNVSGGGLCGSMEVLESPSQSAPLPYSALPLPNPPAGFVLDEQGKVLLVSNKRIATVVDPINNLPLDCAIRRVFRNSRGGECMLLCPADTPVQIVKSVNVEGWSAVSDEEVEAILPTAAYALAKIHMHLVYSGFCYTARGGFCYSEEDILEFQIDNSEDVDGLPTEAIEIACFHMDGSHYMIYTPLDPLFFVAEKDENGVLQIADDGLLEDPAVIRAIDEETEFSTLVEEEAALLDSLIGKR